MPTGGIIINESYVVRTKLNYSKLERSLPMALLYRVGCIVVSSGPVISNIVSMTPVEATLSMIDQGTSK